MEVLIKTCESFLNVDLYGVRINETSKSKVEAIVFTTRITQIVKSIDSKTGEILLIAKCPNGGDLFSKIGYGGGVLKYFDNRNQAIAACMTVFIEALT